MESNKDGTTMTSNKENVIPDVIEDVATTILQSALTKLTLDDPNNLNDILDLKQTGNILDQLKPSGDSAETGVMTSAVDITCSDLEKLSLGTNEDGSSGTVEEECDSEVDVVQLDLIPAAGDTQNEVLSDDVTTQDGDVIGKPETAEEKPETTGNVVETSDEKESENATGKEAKTGALQLQIRTEQDSGEAEDDQAKSNDDDVSALDDLCADISNLDLKVQVSDDGDETTIKLTEVDDDRKTALSDNKESGDKQKVGGGDPIPRGPVGGKATGMTGSCGDPFTNNFDFPRCFNDTEADYAQFSSNDAIQLHMVETPQQLQPVTIGAKRRRDIAHAAYAPKFTKPTANRSGPVENEDKSTGSAPILYQTLMNRTSPQLPNAMTGNNNMLSGPPQHPMAYPGDPLYGNGPVQLLADLDFPCQNGGLGDNRFAHPLNEPLLNEADFNAILMTDDILAGEPMFIPEVNSPLSEQAFSSSSHSPPSGGMMQQQPAFYSHSLSPGSAYSASQSDAHSSFAHSSDAHSFAHYTGSSASVASPDTYVPSPGDSYATVPSPYSDVFAPNLADHSSPMMSPPESNPAQSPRSEMTPDNLDFVIANEFVTAQMNEHQKQQEVLNMIDEYIEDDTAHTPQQQPDVVVDRKQGIVGPFSPAGSYGTPMLSPAESSESNDSSSFSKRLGGSSTGVPSPSQSEASSSATDPDPQVLSKAEQTKQIIRDRIIAKQQSKAADSQAANMSKDRKGRGRPPKSKGGGNKASGEGWRERYRNSVEKLPPLAPKPSAPRMLKATIGLPPGAVLQIDKTKVPVKTAAMTEASAQDQGAQIIAQRKVAAIPSDKLRQTDEDGDSLLSISILKGVHLVKAVIERMRREKIIPDLINTVNKAGQTPLLLACYSNIPLIVRMLLESDADPNIDVYNYSATDDRQHFFTPLHYVCQRGQFNKDVLEILLAHGKTDVNKPNWKMETALHLAIKKHGTRYEDTLNTRETVVNSRQTIKLLVDRRAHFKVGPNDQNPLHYLAMHVAMSACPDGYLAFVKFVMNLIPDKVTRASLLNAKSDRGTVLHIVAAKKFDNEKEKSIILETLHYLIHDCGADPTAKDKSDFPIKRYVHKNDQVINDYLTNQNKKVKRYQNKLNNHNQRSQAEVAAEALEFQEYGSPVAGLSQGMAVPPVGTQLPLGNGYTPVVTSRVVLPVPTPNNNNMATTTTTSHSQQQQQYQQQQQRLRAQPMNGLLQLNATELPVSNQDQRLPNGEGQRLPNACQDQMTQMMAPNAGVTSQMGYMPQPLPQHQYNQYAHVPMTTMIPLNTSVQQVFTPSNQSNCMFY